MTHPQPKYQNTIDLSELKHKGDYTQDGISPDVANRVLLDAAANRVLQYMQSRLYMITRDPVSGLTENGSLVILDGFKPDVKWQTARVTVINMNQNDDGLVELLKNVATKPA